ncbi:ester cyclase [Dyella monticola]|uniref:ester cyclase n=1 Tax=Dyella monticola TaxID=1927958 RepID=UPI0013146BDC|nr:ester cyclase [Dyella monticola]
MSKGVVTLVASLLSMPVMAAGSVATHADVDHWAQTWNSHDINKVMAMFSPDVAIDQPENPKPLDYAGTRAFFGMIFRAYPNFHVDVKQAVVDGSTAVSIERVTGTWSGPFIDPSTGKVTPGNGRTFDHPGVMVIQYGPDHKITHVAIYWDQLTVDRQLGIAPKV